MAFVSGKKKDPNFDYYISGVVSCHVAGENLEPFTVKTLKEMHDTIKQRLHNLPQCTKQCSEQLENVSWWCNTCKSWKEKLEKYHKQHPKKIVWGSMHSWLWPIDPSQVAEVFFGNYGLNPNLKDVSNIFTVWSNCMEFDEDIVRKSQSLKDHRNDLFHSEGQISCKKRDKILKSIRKLLAEKSIKDTLANYKSISDKLLELEGEKIWFEDNTELVIKSIESLQNSNKELTRTLKKKYKKRSEKFKNFQGQIDEMRNDIKKEITDWCRNGIKTTGKIVCAIIALCACLASGLIIFNAKQTEEEITDLQYGCLQETHPKSALKANFSMREYLSFHVERFHGRQWLYEEVERRILVTNQTNHGTLLIAEMGYGKTAFFANLICADQNKAGINLRRHLVSYHMCQFESKLTRNAGLFIHRLVSMLSVKLVDYGNFLRNDRTCLDNYRDRGECDADMFGCFDHCILFPIRREIHTNHRKLIIAIDAIDECQDAMTESNRILDLLVDRIYRLPLWLRFLVTSRHISNLSYLKTYFDVLPLSQTDKRNVQDIVNFLEANYKTQNFSKNDINAQVWNFQFHILESGHSNREDEIPLNLETSFEQYYARNFRRIYGNSYESGKQILAIICASNDPLDVTTLSEIAVTSNKDLIHALLKQELDKIYHFTNIIKGKLHLVHFSLMQWLLKEDCPYRVDMQQGHHDIALYYTHPLILEKHSFDIIDLILHISKASQKSGLIARYKNLNTSTLLTMESRVYPPLYHRLVLAANDGEVVKLAYHHFKDIDATDILLHATALYKAASIGNLDVFTALVEFGADINFRIDFPRMINLGNAIELITYRQWDYGMLDIAAMNGHTNIVKYIMENTYDFKKHNAAHLMPIHLACKFGHLKIVSLLHMSFEWMLDDACLYYSTSGGFLDIVKYCLENGVTDKCIPCNTSMYWIRPNEFRLQGDLYLFNSAIVLYDDWRFINCETALHKAVLGNKTDIVRLLISKKENDVNCHDRGGKSPLMLAIINDYQTVGSILMNDMRFDPTGYCHSSLQFKNTSMLSASELSKLYSNACPEGFSLKEMSDLYDRIWFSQRFDSIDYRDWQRCHPLHYAACRGSLTTLMRLSNTLNLTQLTCSNGSTLIHSAAVCGSIYAVEFLKPLFNKDVKDKAERTPAIYAVMREIRERTAEDSETMINETLEILRELDITKDDIVVSDIDQRSLLHYAIANGHYLVVIELFDRFPDLIRKSLRDVDIHGFNAVEYAVRKMERRSWFLLHNLLFLPIDCKEYDHTRYIMSPVEYTLFKLFLKQSENQINLKLNYREILIESVKKNRPQLFLSVLSCVRPILPMSSVAQLFRHLTKHDASGIMRFLYTTLPRLRVDDYIIEMHADMSACINGSRFSMVHYLALYFTDVLQYQYQFSMAGQQLFLDLYFNHLQPKQFNECYDSDGYNILERAIQGGSETLVKLLLDKGFTSKRHPCELIMMAIVSDKFKKRSNFTWDSELTERFFLNVTFSKHSVYVVLSQTGNFCIVRHAPQYVEPRIYYDELIHFMIHYFENDIPKKCMCSRKAFNRSLVHYFAIQNFELSIQAVEKIYGRNILKCENNQNFTTLYFANIFNSLDVLNYMKAKNVVPKMPNLDAEKLFLFSFQTKFYFDETTYKQCFPNHLDGSLNLSKTRRVMSMLRCVGKLVQHLGVKSRRLAYLMRSTKLKRIIASNYWLLKSIKFIVLGTQGSLINLTAVGVIIQLPSKVTFDHLLEYHRISRKIIDLMRRACQVLNSTYVSFLKHELLKGGETNKDDIKRRLDLLENKLNTIKSLERNCKIILIDVSNGIRQKTRFDNSLVNSFFNEIKDSEFGKRYESSSNFHAFYHSRIREVAKTEFRVKPIHYRFSFNHIRFTMRYIEQFLLNYANAQAVSKAVSRSIGELENKMASIIPTGQR